MFVDDGDVGPGGARAGAGGYYAGDAVPAGHTTTVSDSSSGVDVPPVMAGRYQARSQIGSGSFGDVFLGVDTKHGADIAIKIEVSHADYPQIRIEEEAYRRLMSPSALSPAGRDGHGSAEHRMPVGFPRIFAAGLQQPIAPRQSPCRYIVMDVLGPTLDDLRKRLPPREDGKRGFDNLTLLMLADQMLQRLETIHDAGMLHRDLKPENFLIGAKGTVTENVVHVVDFGLCKLWLDERTGAHISQGKAGGTVGTLRYMSLRQHRGQVTSRGDDVECLCYVLAFLGCGQLPWQGLRGDDARDRTLALKADLMGSEIAPGCPEVLCYMLDYLRSGQLGFEDRPPYAEFRTACRGAACEEYVKQRLEEDPRTDADAVAAEFEFDAADFPWRD